MPKVVFKEDRVVQDEHAGTKKETRYTAGEVYEMSEASASRWIKRGVAEIAEDGTGDAKGAGKSGGARSGGNTPKKDEAAKKLADGGKAE